MFGRRALALAVCGVVSATLACGGRAPTSAAPATPTITLTATDCTADQLGALAPEHFAGTLVNKTSYPALFSIQRILDGHDYRELELFIAEQQRLFLANEEPLNPGPPSFTDRVVITAVDSTQTERFEATLLSGTYGIVCREQRHPTLWAAYLIGPLRVP